MSNPFLYKYLVLLQTTRFSISTQVNCQFFNLFQAIPFSQTVLIQTNHFSIGLLFIHTQLNAKTILFQAIQFSLSTVSMPNTVLFQTNQFCMSTQFKYQNSSTSRNSVSIRTLFSST